MGVVYDDAIIYEPEYRKQWINSDLDPVLLNTHVGTVDVRGNVTPKLYVMADVAVSVTDSSVFYQSEDVTGYSETDPTSGYSDETYESSMNTPQVGVYVKVQSKYIDGWPMTLEAIYLPSEFYSPYSLSNPSRFPGWRKHESYLNGGSLRYSPNMAGLNLKIEPTFNRGYFDVQYGQHRQIEESEDVILFNYRLNGRNMWESSNSWTKHKPLFIADSGNGSGPHYVARAGADLETGGGIKQFRQNGGLYGGTWELWESFVAYENASQINAGEVPTHAKWSSFFSFMGGYDIGHWFGTDRNIMMTGYVSLSGLSSTFAPIAYSEEQKDMLMTSFYGQFEPAVALFPSFHLVGILGMETFRSDKAYVLELLSNAVKDMPTNTYYYRKAPINYLETAVGLGFDWDLAGRVGLHVRYKYMTHSDETAPENDFHFHYISAETKAWF